MTQSKPPLLVVTRAVPAQRTKNIHVNFVAANWQLIIKALVILAAGLLAYWPVLTGKFIWDDAQLVTGDTYLRSVAGLRNIWSGEDPNWPLASTALWIEWHLWGSDPLGYHLVNLGLHLASCFLIWHLLNRLGLRWGWLGGLMFCVHPLAVETVAWISEMKSTLSLLFFLLSLDAYLDYEEDKKRTSYLSSLAYFLLAMLAKTTVAMLPFVLLLYCWWKRQRIVAADMKTVYPYFIIVLTLGLIAYHLQNVNVWHDSAIENRSVFSRFVIAGTALLFYLGKFLVPIGLLPIYPRWSMNSFTVTELLTLPALSALVLTLWIEGKAWSRHALFGIGFFALNAAPGLGFVRIYYMDVSPVGDHIAYLPIIGLIGLVVAGVEALQRIFIHASRLFLAVATVGVALWTWKSHNYCAIFKDNLTLWTYAVQRNPMSFATHYCLAATLNGIPNRLDDAVDQYEESEALRVSPDWNEGYYDLGILEQNTKGDLPKALTYYKKAIAINPNLPEPHYQLATVLVDMPGKTEEGISEFNAALKINPNYAQAHNDLGYALMNQTPDRMVEAIDEFKAAVKLDPHYATAYNNLGVAQSRIAGQISYAIDDFEAALRIKPDFAEAHYNLGMILLRMPGQRQKAIDHLEKALEIDPHLDEARAVLRQLR